MKRTSSDTTKLKYDPLHLSILISTLVLTLINFLITDYSVSIWIVRILVVMCIPLLYMHKNILENSRNPDTLASLPISNSDKLFQISKLSFQTKEITNLLVISQAVSQYLLLLMNNQIFRFISSLFYILFFLFAFFLLFLFFMKKHQIREYKKELYHS